MKTGFYFTPSEWQEWAAANAHRFHSRVPMQTAPGDYILVTDQEDVVWRVDIIEDSEASQALAHSETQHADTVNQKD